jgi:hypothetical protein
LPDIPTQNNNLGKFWRALEWMGWYIFYGHLEYITAIWNIFLPFGIYYCHLEYIPAIWNILLPFGIFYGHLVV